MPHQFYINADYTKELKNPQPIEPYKDKTWDDWAGKKLEFEEMGYCFNGDDELYIFLVPSEGQIGYGTKEKGWKDLTSPVVFRCCGVTEVEKEFRLGFKYFIEPQIRYRGTLIFTSNNFFNFFDESDLSDEEEIRKILTKKQKLFIGKGSDFEFLPEGVLIPDEMLKPVDLPKTGSGRGSGGQTEAARLKDRLDFLNSLCNSTDVPSLIAALKSGDETVKDAWLLAMSLMGSDNAVTLMLDWLKEVKTK